MNLSKNHSLILLHIIIIIWGFTGVLGKLIDLNSNAIVWNRMIIAFFSLLIINYKYLKVSLLNLVKFILNGRE